jgi:hypothetical protein
MPKVSGGLTGSGSTTLVPYIGFSYGAIEVTLLHQAAEGRETKIKKELKKAAKKATADEIREMSVR